MLFALCRLLHHRVAPTTVLLIVAILVVLINPLDLVSVSFYLSFIAVTILLFSVQQVSVRHLKFWQRWFLPQWSVAIGFVPVGILFFSQVSSSSLLANSMAIPWASFTVVPLVLLSLVAMPVSSALSSVLLHLANDCLALLWWPLHALGHWSLGSFFVSAPSVISMVLAVIASVVLLLPKMMPGKWIALLLYLPIFFPKTVTIPPGAVRISLLAVGQGLSVVVQTARHTVLYDTGPSSDSGYSAAKAMILPFLRYQHIHQLDRMVVSHQDNDHAGGATDILQAIPVARIDSSSPGAYPAAISFNCHHSKPWRWDHVRFRYLSVNSDLMTGENDHSCVLQITSGKHSILLPGDITRKVEQGLVRRYQGGLRSDILVAPHHGSPTSSSLAFINAVKPRYVLFATGFANHFFFPNNRVVARYREVGVNMLDTGSAGAISCEVSNDTTSCQLAGRHNHQNDNIAP